MASSSKRVKMKHKETTLMEDKMYHLPTSFFKVILPSTPGLKKLRLPRKFVEKYGAELSDAAFLTDSIGGTWRVTVEEKEEQLYFTAGWEKFVEDRFINYGYFVVFKYKGHSRFKVNIFDMTATEVHYPDHIIPNSTSETEESSDDDSIKVVASFPVKQKISTPRRRAQNEYGGGEMLVRKHDREDETEEDSDDDSMKVLASCPGKQKISTPRSWARNERGVGTRLVRKHELVDEWSSSSTDDPWCDSAERPKFVRRPWKRGKYNTQDRGRRTKTKHLEINYVGCTKSNDQMAGNPWFTVTLQPRHMTKGASMYLPAAFRKQLPSGVERVRVHDSDGRKWKLGVVEMGGKRHYFYQGWPTFVEEKNLKIGDKCVFELVDASKCMVMVSIS